MAAISVTFNRGAHSVLIRDSDSPVPPRILVLAFDRFTARDRSGPLRSVLCCSPPSHAMILG